MKQDEVIERVSLFIARHQLLVAERGVLVALSGGADSVALLRLLLALNYRCEAAHCNFQLRGEESERDELFVRRLCSDLQVPLHTIRFDTMQRVKESHLSVEMAARQLRYDWFEQLISERHLQAVAVAHHQDDSIETMLINLIRGTGIDGLLGIQPRHGHVVRPLLALSRQDLLAYLESLEQPYVTDSTNLHDTYVRNKIRLHLLPLMEQINPSVRESLTRTMSHLQQASQLYHQAVDEALAPLTHSADGSLQIPIAKLMQSASPQALLHELLLPRGFNRAQEEDIYRALNGPSGRTFSSATHQLIKDRERLYILPIAPKAAPTLQIEYVKINDRFTLPRTSEVACIDAAKVKEPLTLRLAAEGDWFIPLGMKGRKKLSDYLTDCKVPLHLKRQQYVVCCGQKIVWVVGRRLDNRFRLDSTTTEAIILRCTTYTPPTT